MDACILEMLVVLIQRYMRLEAHALAAGTHAHVLTFQSLYWLYGMARIGICRRTRTQWGTPDLEPALSVLPPDMQQAIRGAIQAEQTGRSCDCCDDCIHMEQPTKFNLNVLESHFIWTIAERPPSLN